MEVPPITPPEGRRSALPPPNAKTSSSHGYLRGIRSYLIFTVFLFALSIAFGYYLGSYMGESYSEGTLEQLRRMLGWIVDLPPILMMLFIFFNNAIKCLLIIPLGAVLGLAPLLFVMVNGVMLGLLSFSVGGSEGMALVLAALLPHGVLEIPALLISSAMGLKMGYEGLRRLRGLGSLKRELTLGLRFYVKWLLPVLFLAAFVETFVTPAIASLFS